MGSLGTDRNGDGVGPGSGGGGFRKALLAVQIVLIAAAPCSFFIGKLFYGFELTPEWERMYYFGIVTPTFVALGLLRAPQIIEAVRAWRGGPQQNGG